MPSIQRTLDLMVNNEALHGMAPINAKKEKKTIEWERREISSRKSEIPRECFMQKWHNKGQKWYGPNRSRRYYEEVARIHRRTIQKKILLTQTTTVV